MRSQSSREMTLAVSVLLGVVVLTASVAINLLQRMTPRLEQIMRENVFSVQAVEDMLAALAVADAPGPGEKAPETRFSQALVRAAQNVTEPDEKSLIDELRTLEAAALGADPMARARATAALQELGRINHEAMQRAVVEVTRLGYAGAWALALLGMLGVGVSLLVIRRLHRQIVAPLGEIQSVLASRRGGELRRRCSVLSTSDEMRQMLYNLNELLDAQERTLPTDVGPESDLLRQLIPKLLDARGGASLIVDRKGRIVAASGDALEALASERGGALREAVRRVGQGEPDEAVREVERVELGALLALSP